jgi:predicted phage tail component-like protein
MGVLVMGLMGLTFNGKHCSEMGLVMRSKNRPILPSPKIITEEVMGADGSLDFSDANVDGRTKYNDRIITVNFSIIESSSAVLHARARDIARWLNCGEKLLVFDDQTMVYYLARVNNKIDLEKQIVSLQEFTVQFKCRPFMYSFINSLTENLQLGQGLQLGYGLRFDMKPATFSISENTDITVYNAGDYVKPTFKITGTADIISLTCNGKTLTYNVPLLAGKELIIDSEKYTATLNGELVNNNMTGSFFELENGNNTINVSGENLDIDLDVIFKYRYL